MNSQRQQLTPHSQLQNLMAQAQALKLGISQERNTGFDSVVSGIAPDQLQQSSPYFIGGGRGSDSQDFEKVFQRSYFEQQVLLQGGGDGHQDFASNEEEMSSLEGSPQASTQKQDNMESQISQIMEVLSRLNNNHNEQGEQQSAQSTQRKDQGKSPFSRFHTDSKQAKKLVPPSTTKTYSQQNASKQQSSQVMSKSPSYQSLANPKQIFQNRPLMVKSPSKASKVQSAMEAYSAITTQATQKKSPFKALARSPIIKKKKIETTTPVTKRKDDKKWPSNDFLNQDLVSRLFINSQRQQEVIDQKRQREMLEVQQKPSISPKSRQIALNSERFSKPLFNSERYKQEIETYLSRKEEAARLKYLQEREKELAEDQEMMANCVHNRRSLPSRSPQQQREDFLRKYHNQVRQWESRVNGAHVSPSHVTNEEEQSTFHPQINKKSKQIAKDIAKIESRVWMLQHNKQKKIDIIKEEGMPKFVPEINKISQILAIEGRRSMLEPLQRTSKVPLLTQYLSDNRVKERYDNDVRRSHSNNILRPSIKMVTEKKLHKTNFQAVSQRTLPRVDKKFAKTFSPIMSSRTEHRHQKLISNLESQEWINPISIQTYHLRKVIPLQNTQEQEGVLTEEEEEQNEQSQQEVLKSDYAGRIFQNTQNLQQFLQGMKQHSSLTSNNEIFSEYLKLRQELDDQLSGRNSKSELPTMPQQQFGNTKLQRAYTVVDNYNGGRQQQKKQMGHSSDYSESSITSGTVMVNNHCSFQKDPDIQITDDDFQSAEGQSYPIDFVGTLGPSPIVNIQCDSDSYFSKQLPSLQLDYQSSPKPHHTISSSADISADIDIRNAQVQFLLSSQNAPSTKSLSNLRQSNDQQSKHGRQSSKGIVEVESILNNIKQSIDMISSRINHQEGMRSTYEVLEVDNEESEDVSQQMGRGSMISDENEPPLDESQSNKDIKECCNQFSKEATPTKSSTSQIEAPYQGLGGNTSIESKREIEEIARFVDNQTLEFIENSIGLQSTEKKFASISDSVKHDELVQRLIQSNAKNQGHISIPMDVMQEIEEYGLDSMSIIREVIEQFKHLFSEHSMNGKDNFITFNQ